MYYVYILQGLKDESYYPSFTADVGARLKQDNAGSVGYTLPQIVSCAVFNLVDS